MRGVGPRAAGVVAVLVVTLGAVAAPASAATPTISFIPGVVAPGGTVIIHNTDAAGSCAPEPDRIDNISLNVDGPEQRIVGGSTFAPDANGNWSWSWTVPAMEGTYSVTAACGTRFTYAVSTFVVASTSGAQITGNAAMSDDGVREIDVEASSETYDTCSGGSSSPDTLGFPNGQCTISQPVSVTNVGAAGEIFVVASPMEPGDGSGPAWQPCAIAGDIPSATASCDGPVAGDGDFAGLTLPGPDQFHQDIGQVDAGGTMRWSPVADQPGCDGTFSVASGETCAAATGATAEQVLRVTGPSSTTDLSAQWSNTVTWVAMP